MPLAPENQHLFTTQTDRIIHLLKKKSRPAFGW